MWKQYLLVALLLVGGLAVIAVVSLLALAPQFATPPALVAGDRLVLAAAELPAAGALPKRIGPPLVGEERAFWLAQPARGQALAFRASWAPREGQAECRVEVVGAAGGRFGYAAFCAGAAQSSVFFDEFGNAGPGAARGLDQYLVSVSDQRLIANLSRLIRPAEKVPAPSSP